MIRVLLVNEVRLVSDAIAAVMESVTDMAAVGTAATPEEAVAQLDQCDILLVSADLPADGALQLTRTVIETSPSVRVLVLGLSESRERVLRYIEAGAAGYVLKDDSVDDLLARIRAAYAGQALVSPELTAALIGRISELARKSVDREAGAEGTADLTSREHEILQMIGQGLTNQEIAGQLFIEIGTVKNHVHSILQKLNVSSRRAAAAYLAISK